MESEEIIEEKKGNSGNCNFVQKSPELPILNLVVIL